MATTSFIIVGSSTQIQVTMTELDSDSIQFDLEVVPVGSEDVIGDLRFFDMSVDDEALLSSLSFVSLDGGTSHNFRTSADGIDDIPGPPHDWDIGIEIGDDGLGGGDDFQSASFVINSSVPITIADFFDFAYRVTSVGPEGGDRSDSDFGTTILNPDIEIVKTTEGLDDVCPQIIVGETVHWTYTVTNPGDTPLANVVVTDDAGTPGVPGDDFTAIFQSGDTNLNSLLDPGETWIFTAQGTATDGEYENIATVEGDFTVGSASGTVSDEEDDCYEGVTPAITIVKKTNGTDNVCPEVLAGSTVTWTYEVTNTGEVDELENIVVLDDNGNGAGADDFNPTFTGGDTDADGKLDFGETWTYSATGIAIDGEYTNVATVTGDATDEVSNTVEVTDDEEDCYEGLTPAINIVKMTNGTDDQCPIVEVGSTVTWTYFVTNTGEIDELENIIVVDDNGNGPGADDFNPTFTGGDTDADGKLDFGETWAYSATGIAVVGEYENVATVTGLARDSFDNTASVTDNEDDCYFGFQGPGVRTPGFWQSPNGLQFWDGIQDNEDKGGQPGFADGELLYAIAGKGTGMLVGDFNTNGVEDAGEDTIFISLNDALVLINASQKVQQDKRYELGRDTVASWLNYLAGNNIGDPGDDDGDPAFYIDASVDWLLEHFDSNGDGALNFGGPAVKASSAAWQLASGDLLAGREIHSALDGYNNDGTIGLTAFENDGDSSLLMAAMQTLSAGGTDLMHIV